MASSIFTSIDSIFMAASYWNTKTSSSYNDLMMGLKHGITSLKVFLLCIRSLKSASSEFLCSRIEDAIGRILKQTEFDGDDDYGEWFSRILEEIYLLVKETYECYTIMPKHRDQSSSLTVEEIVWIVDSILVNKAAALNHFFQYRIITAAESVLVSFDVQMNALEVQLTFLKDLLLFTILTSVENRQLENLLIHFEAVAISVAQAFVKDAEITYANFFGEMQLECSVLLKKIKPTDPQVCMAYSQALSCSRLSKRLHTPTQDMDDETMVTLKNFLDSLISVLWDLLEPDACQLDCMKNQLQMVYEGLRFFRTILKQHIETFDRKILVQIGVSACEAGISIFSSHQKIDSEIDSDFSDLLQRMKVIQAEVEKRTPPTSAINFSVTNELGYVDSVLENLMELTNRDSQPVAEILPQTMLEELVILRSFLGKPMDLLNEDQELLALRNLGLKVAYRVEFLIDRLLVGGTPNSFSNLFDSIMEDVRGINTKVKKISLCNATNIKMEKMIWTSSHQRSENTPSMTNGVVGFHDEGTSIINRLTRGSNRLRTVVISGMAGSGKTTLALKVYNDPFVTHHFHARAWCPVSQILDKKEVLLMLLNQIDPGRSLDMTENDLTESLWRSLKGKRYMIFLDDVWTSEAWNSLKASFPNDCTQSRILLTSRHHNIAPPDISDGEPLLLRPLNDDESLTLLGMKLFPGKGWPPTLNVVGNQIVENCKGLPLTIVIIAGVLAKMERGSWNEILDIFRSRIVSSAELCVKTLELSYTHLPDYLKPCLLYFGVFPEDHKISVKFLIRLWMAEGFVRKTNSMRPEDVAEEYMGDLIDRSLIIVDEHRSTGGPKTCRVHDLIRDFCLERAKQVSFFHLLHRHDQLSAFNEPCYLRRLCFHSNPADFVESKLFCPRARSLLFFPTNSGDSWLYRSSISFHKFKLVKVLHILNIPLVYEIPSEIELLIQLNYLSVEVRVKSIPSWIGNLFNLETFIVNAYHTYVRLPHSIFSLQKLKYLIVPNGAYFDDFESSPSLFSLETFDSFRSRDLEKDASKFPNIRRLKLNVGGGGVPKIFVLLAFLNKLESLSMSGCSCASFPDSKSFSLPENLKKLTLSEFNLSTREISIIGKLPNLEVLKLGRKSFSGRTLEMKEGEFSKLRCLKLYALSIVKWTVDDEQLPNLEKLVLKECEDLEEIPSCLESLPTLREIRVNNCPQVTSLVKHIQEVQEDFGNSVKVQ